MQKVSDNLNIGLIKLLSAFRILCMNPNARKIPGLTIFKLSQIVLAYFQQIVQSKIALSLKQCCSSGAYISMAMIIDVFNAFPPIHSRRVIMPESYGDTLFSIPKRLPQR
jgi:hypothetical protein